MKYGMWSSYLYRLSPEDMVRAFAQKGWHYLELSTEHAQMLLQRGDPLATGRAFRAYAQRYGVAFPQGPLWLQADIAGENQEYMVQTLKDWLDLFYGVGIEACVLHAGGWESRQPDADPATDAARVRALTDLCAHIEGRDMVICLENLTGRFKSITQLRQLIDAVGSPQLAVCLDTGHLNLTEESQAQFIAQAGGLLRALHIADNDGKKDLHMMPYGRGNVPWDQVLGALAQLDPPYEGLFNFEIPGETKAPLEVLLSKLDYLREMAAYMIEQAGKR